MSEKLSPSNNQYVIFKLEDESYGIDILQVETIEKVMDVTRVPHSPFYVEGVINLRGEVVPVINLRKRFNLNNTSNNEDNRIIIVTLEEMIVGLLVDSSSEVIHLNMEDIEELPKLSNNIENDYVDIIGKKDKRIIMLLDLKKVLGISASESIEH
ncbi:MAG: purine-binding chemotaxis protein CheW [Alkaliphilus sp.]|mgnify:CR=1 FL=1|nr:purine-binding chemotaxis protein CheW [Alkaliphilus sp.]